MASRVQKLQLSTCACSTGRTDRMVFRLGTHDTVAMTLYPGPETPRFMTVNPCHDVSMLMISQLKAHSSQPRAHTLGFTTKNQCSKLTV